MSKRKILIAGIIVIIIAFIVDFLFPDLLSNKVISYLVIALGLGIFIKSFQTENSAGIFAGGFIFFSGVILLVINSFIIWNPSRMLMPALLVAGGLSSFFSFLNGKKFFYLIISAVFFLLGFNFIYARMSFKFDVFINSIPKLIVGIGIIAIVIFLLLYVDKKRKAEDDLIS